MKIWPPSRRTSPRPTDGKKERVLTLQHPVPTACWLYPCVDRFYAHCDPVSTDPFSERDFWRQSASPRRGLASLLLMSLSVFDQLEDRLQVALVHVSRGDPEQELANSCFEGIGDSPLDLGQLEQVRVCLRAEVDAVRGDDQLQGPVRDPEVEKADTRNVRGVRKRLKSRDDCRARATVRTQLSVAHASWSLPLDS